MSKRLNDWLQAILATLLLGSAILSPAILAAHDQPIYPDDPKYISVSYYHNRKQVRYVGPTRFVPMKWYAMVGAASPVILMGLAIVVTYADPTRKERHDR
jgi:hypothetical protein